MAAGAVDGEDAADDFDAGGGLASGGLADGAPEDDFGVFGAASEWFEAFLGGEGVGFVEGCWWGDAVASGGFWFVVECSGGVCEVSCGRAFVLVVFVVGHCGHASSWDSRIFCQPMQATSASSSCSSQWWSSYGVTCQGYSPTP